MIRIAYLLVRSESITPSEFADDYLASDIRKEWFEYGKTFIGQLKPIYTREIH